MPSSSSGVRRTAACAQKPAIAARSAPPQQRSNPTGSGNTSRVRNRASRTAAVLRAQPASSIPVPKPTTATGSAFVSAATKTAAAVVFPIPMSPAISRSAPASTSSSAMRRPAAIARGGLLVGQRVLDGDIAAAAPHFVGADLLRGRVGVDRQVRDPHRRTGDVGQRVDRRPAGVDVGDHLGGHFRRVRLARLRETSVHRPACAGDR